MMPGHLASFAVWRRRLDHALTWVLAVGLVLGALFVLQFRRQTVSYLTHWKGSPTHTVPYVAYSRSDPPEFHLAAVGDVGDSGARINATGAAVARAGRSTPFDALLVLGDNSYPVGDPAKLPSTVFEPFAATLRSGADLLAILGNHDVKQGNAAAQVRALHMPGRWWAKRFGDVLIVGLDSNEPDNPQQRSFLERTLRTTTAAWRIVALHHPPYSAGYQGSSRHVRDVFSPIFERYGVQLVLSGHDHDYQRSKPIDGVTYVVSGAAAGTRRTGEGDFTAASFSWHHFVDVAVFPDRLVLRAVNQDLRVADQDVIRLDRVPAAAPARAMAASGVAP
jgi:3',5'-cyclic AMP phosphodiesterase CpdA